MSHFARVESGKVVEVIRAEQDFINSGAVGDPTTWIQTSIRTVFNQHPEGTPLRGNFASIGHHYDADHDVFYPEKPFASWTLDTEFWRWEPPVAYPNDGEWYNWDEATQSWIQN